MCINVSLLFSFILFCTCFEHHGTLYVIVVNRELIMFCVGYVTLLKNLMCHVAICCIKRIFFLVCLLRSVCSVVTESIKPVLHSRRLSAIFLISHWCIPSAFFHFRFLSAICFLAFSLSPPQGVLCLFPSL